MAEYKVEFYKSAAKEFRALPTEIKNQVGIAIDALEQTPRPFGVRKLEGGTNLYRIRVSSYRVVYEIYDKEKLIRVTRIRHRRDVYR